ncbi:M56 family metallopeptidase [Telluribacter humicola]|uniref:M56 family metallopeptidase n=1 Tax=Telluribacter humicola TaxID=1720261 RepID=UPI001A978313|nr:M56 family metallopeptidase [Telluribacter humicola]
MEAIVYIEQVSLYWLLLYACYWLFLRHHTFFRWNRAYLLGSLLAAFLLPLVQYPEAVPVIPAAVYEVYQLPMAVPGEMTAATTSTKIAPTPPAVLSWEDVLWALYAMGFVFMGIRLFRHLRSLFQFVREGTSIHMDDYTLVLSSNKSVGSFSFLKWIVVNPNDYENHLDTILNHELVHVRQRHSLDVLLVEVLRVLFWFNPVLLLYKRSLQQVHEYLADQQAPNRDRYAEFLVAYALDAPVTALSHHFFNSSLLKNRVRMLYKHRNSRWSLGKYVVAVVLVGATAVVASGFRSNDGSGKTTTDERVQIEGIVVGTDGSRLESVTIKSENKRFRTFTDEEGQYLIQVPVGSKLTFEAEGYKAVTVQVASWQIINTTLAQIGTTVPSTIELSPSIKRVEVYADPVTTGVFRLIPTRGQSDNSASSSTISADEESPRFPGGAEALSAYFSQHANYPSQALNPNAQGKVLVNFLVSSNGEISDVEVVKGPGFGLEEESARLVASMPTWIPGQSGGKRVAMHYHLSIDWQLDLDPDKTGTKEVQVNVGQDKASYITVKYYKSGARKRFMGYFWMYGKDTLSENALYVLNGTPMKSKDFMKEIPIDEFRAINVLNSTVARALYGEKGANGAVLVMTTKNTEKKP